MPSFPSDPAATAPPSLVLLVEDSPIIAMNTEALLLELEVGGVRTAANVAEALALIEAERFDLAILDLHLGDEDSLPVAERLVALAVPIVFATGFGEDLSPASAWGTAHVLKKPYGFNDLERIVRGA
ncbi:MAG: hypothetical protein ABS86_06075 [Sphingobium sp. SCN 64-10]|nr:MAG: hypothetical protein ABS86_06075 [Sphingobium sp. SCN 64-10]OJY64394.1 MAG: hypothetical protein BGP16_02395 [Sphingobium sp. 66-54]